MSDIPNAIRRRLEVLTAVGLATVSPPTDPTGPTSGARNSPAAEADDGGDTDGR